MRFSARDGRVGRWTGVGLIVTGAAGLLLSFAVPRFSRTGFEYGVLYTVTRYDQVLPLLGAGIAAAQMSARLSQISVALFAIGILSGGLISEAVAAAFASHPGLVGYVFLIGPVCCVATGIALAVPRRLSACFGPPAVFLSGASLGMVINFADRSVAAWLFTGGAVLAGVWLVLACLLVWRGFARPWFSIPARVFGSWLIAIGTMLGAAQLIPRPPVPEPPAAIDPPSNPEAPLIIQAAAGDASAGRTGAKSARHSRHRAVGQAGRM